MSTEHEGLALEHLPLTWLLDRQEPTNPKLHALKAIEQSMQEHGFIDPVLVDERTKKVLGGHGRLEVLAMLRDMGRVPPTNIGEGVVAGERDWLIPTITGVRSEDDHDARRMLVRLNRLSERGGWNAEKLTAFDLGDDLLNELWSADELDDLFADDLGLLEDDPEGTDGNVHADLPPARKGEPPPPRQAQGLRELVLLFQVPQHLEVMESLAVLRRLWGQEVNALIVHRALTAAAREAAADG